MKKILLLLIINIINLNNILAEISIAKNAEYLELKSKIMFIEAINAKQKTPLIIPSLNNILKPKVFFPHKNLLLLNLFAKAEKTPYINKFLEAYEKIYQATKYANQFIGFSINPAILLEPIEYYLKPNLIELQALFEMQQKPKNNTIIISDNIANNQNNIINQAINLENLNTNTSIKSTNKNSPTQENNQNNNIENENSAKDLLLKIDENPMQRVSFKNKIQIANKPLVAKVKKSAPINIKIQSIVLDNKEFICFINGEIYKEKDKINNNIIKKINEDNIIITNEEGLDVTIEF